MIIPYNASKEERDRITAEREKKLYQSFENMRKQIDDQIQTMNFSTVSERVKRQQLEEIRNELQKQLQSHYNALESGLKDDMVNIGQQVLNESETFYKGLNMPIGMSITSFPVEIMNNVVNGSVYQEKWYLSRALWGDYTEKLDQINEVISNGIGLNLSSFEIAKQLEQYVDPSAMTPSKTIVTHCLQDPVTGKLYSIDYVKRHPEKDWTGFKEKDSRFRYGKVDYNAQRLARTLINHAYQQNVVHQAQANPFATGVRWDASGGERMCEICEDRDGKIFPADDVPLDHPNGMCTFEVVTDLNMMEMSDVLADFVNGVPTDYDDKLYDWYNDRAEVPIQVPDTGKVLENAGIKQMTEEEYLEWQKNNSTESLMWKEAEQYDRWSDERAEISEIIERATSFYGDGVGYVQCSDGSKEVNAYLRRGERPSFENVSNRKKRAESEQKRMNAIQNTIDAMNVLTHKTQLDRDMVVDRWAGIDALERMGIIVPQHDRTGRIGHAFCTNGIDFNVVKQLMDKSFIGSIITDKGFMSASACSDLNVFRGSDVKFSILAPQGTNCYITENTNESEIVFAPGMRQEIVGINIINSEAIDYEGKPHERQSIEVIVRITEG